MPNITSVKQANAGRIDAASTEEIRIWEIRLRRAARQQGLVLLKARFRDTQARGFGGYMLVTEDNVIKAGLEAHAYSMQIDDVENYLLGEGDMSDNPVLDPAQPDKPAASVREF